NLLLFALNSENDGIELLTDLEQFGRFADALRPGHLGDVHETFDTGLQFNKRAVRHEIDDLAVNLGANGELVFDVVPGIVLGLLETEGNALFLAVDVDDHHLDFFALLQHFVRMADAAPTHVRDVEQAVHAVEIDERTEIGDILDDTLADL